MQFRTQERYVIVSKRSAGGARHTDATAIRTGEEFRDELTFYTDLGFRTYPLDDGLASVNLGAFAFLLQAYDVDGFAGNFMMQMLVKDVTAWWMRIAELDLAGRYAVTAPRAPALQPWGLVVAFVFDPSGVLWHIAEKKAS